MKAGISWKNGIGLRVATLLLPPLGLLLLWRSSIGLGRKILGTTGVAVYSLLYAALICLLLIRYDGLMVEWRGGYVPALTFHKTIPNYEILESQRARQKRLAIDASSSTNHSEYWTGFRGPHRDGQYNEQPILTDWPASGPPLLWRQPCGDGYASFAVAGGVAFTIEQRREREVVAAYDLETGREVWTHGWEGSFTESMGGDGPRATPAYSEGRIYALGALGELRCLEAATGKLIWSHNIVAETGAPIPTYGIAASPLVIDDKIIVLSGAGRGKSAVGYHKVDGQLLWSALDDVTGYASPVVFTLAGQPQVVICCETQTVALQIENGRLLWSYPWRVLNNQFPIAQPVLLSTNRFLLSAGYFTGCAAVEIVERESGLAAQTAWKNKNLKNKFTSSVFLDGYVYGLDEDILTCLEAASGERKWKGGHYGYGQLILASGYLIVLTGSGEIALVKATPEKHEERARFPAITGKTWNHPVIAEGKLLVRNGAEMACFDLSLPR